MTRKKAKRILRWYRFCRFMTILALLVCIGSVIGGYLLTQTAYASYTSLSPATDLEERLTSYWKAIQLCPDRLEAYILLLDAYGEDSSFSKAESEAFLNSYNRNHTKFDISDPDYGTLHRKAGILYVTGYEDVNSASRLRLALPFLKIASANLDGTEEDALAVNCYCRIGGYYRDYLWAAGAGTREVTPEQMDQLLSEIRDTVTALGQNNSPDGVYNRLSFSVAVCDLLYSQRNVLAGTVSKDEVEEILDDIYESLPSMDSLQREQTRQLLKTLEDNEEIYREMTLRAFSREETTEYGTDSAVS